MHYQEFIIKTIKEAGQILLTARRDHFTVDIKNKNPRDLVTSVDKKINKFLTDKIKEEFPSHSIYSEEGLSTKADAEFKWTIDPIDGTTNFSRGIPHYSIALGLLKNNQPFSGAVLNPITNELYSFQKDKGAFLNNKNIKVSQIEKLDQAHILLHAGRNPQLKEWGGQSYTRLLENAYKTSNLASSALDICFVAAGRVEAVIYGTLSTLDISPALGILNEAGGVAQTDKKESICLDKSPQKIYIANNKKILKELIQLLES